MEKVNYNPRMLAELIAQRFFAREPLVLVDVGCSGGIWDIFRKYEDQLVAHGFDPQRSEIQRLTERETLAGVKYHAAYVGLPSEHPFVQRRREHERAGSG